MKDLTVNLPTEISALPRFFPVGADKTPHIKKWSDPVNQMPLADVNSQFVGFDTCGHGRGDDYLFLDFDHVLNDNGEFISCDAESWYNYLKCVNSYCERSLSGHGLHFLFKPSPNNFPAFSGGDKGSIYFTNDKKNGAKIEVFYGSAGRYCLLTGDLFNCKPNASIVDGGLADDVFQTVLDEIKRRQPAADTSQKNSSLPAPMNAQDTPDYDLFRANIMLDAINPADLADSDWLAVISACKNIGIPYPTVDAWNKRDPQRYDEKENQARWNSLKDSSYNIETLHGKAKLFGYDEKTTWHEYHDKYKVDSTPRDDIQRWQLDNGEIEPQLLTKLKSEAERIKNISDFAFAVKDTSTLRFLGAFQYYSCFAHITVKFFADLKRAKADVAKKIKEYNYLKRNEDLDVQLKGDSASEEIAALTPSDSDFALSLVNITEIKNKVNTYETAARKAHKTFLDQKKLDVLNAKYQAERNAYDSDPPSTQRNITDCPIDLILPLGVYFDLKGIRIVDYDKPVGNRGRPVIEACANPIVPIRAFREVAKRGQNPKSKDLYEIAIRNSNGWRRVTVEGRTLFDPRRILELADYGACIVDAKFTAKFFAKIISINEANGRLKVTKTFLQPGWQDKDFKFFAYPTGGDDYIVKNADFDYNSIFTPQGDKHAWLSMLRRVIYHSPNSYSPNDVIIERPDGSKQSFSKENNPANFSDKPNLVAAMILGSSFGAPLVAPLGIRNPQLVLGFDSGNGKTAAAKFAVSFFGDPFELCPTCNATENFLEDLAVKLNDFPHAVDELQAAKKHIRENMDELVYKFSGGTTRGRSDIQGNAKPVFHYRGFRLFTGEQTIINNSSGQGALSRIFEIRKHDLFADNFAIEIHNFTQNNFGHFGKFFTTNFIPNNLSRIQERFDYWRKIFSSDSFNLLSSHSTFFAYSLTGLQFGLEAAGFSQDEAFKITFDVADSSKQLIDDAPDKFFAKNVNRALPDLLNFIEAHPKNFAREVENESIISADANETFGIKFRDGRIAFNPLCLRNILSNELNYPSARQIINGFAEHDFFLSENAKGKKHMKRLPSWMNESLGKTSWYYVLKSPDELDIPA